MYLADDFVWADPYFSFIHAVLFAGAIMLIGSFLVHTNSTHVTIITVPLPSCTKAKGISFLNTSVIEKYVCQ